MIELTVALRLGVPSSVPHYIFIKNINITRKFDLSHKGKKRKFESNTINAKITKDKFECLVQYCFHSTSGAINTTAFIQRNFEGRDTF